MSRITFNIAAKCDKAGRSENQDNYWVCPDLSEIGDQSSRVIGSDDDVELSYKGALLVVADGMGGMNAGEKASELIISCVKEHFSVIPDDVLTNEVSILAFMRKAIEDADNSIKNYARVNRSAEGLGSTIVMLWMLGGKAYCAWCGDSRIYRYNPNNSLVRLSHDHSFVQGMVDDGKISEEDAFDHPDGNIVTRSLGDNGERVNPEMKVYDICERDVFMLCSDGLCGLLQDGEIENIISTNCSSSKDALKALWEAGTRKGWSDNATIDLMCVLSGGKRPKGIAVGYPVQKAVPSNVNVSKVEKTNDSNTSKQTKSFKSWYFVVPIVVLLVAAFIIYFVADNHTDGESEKFEFVFDSSQSDQYSADEADANEKDIADNEVLTGSSSAASQIKQTKAESQGAGSENVAEDEEPRTEQQYPDDQYVQQLKAVDNDVKTVKLYIERAKLRHSVLKTEKESFTNFVNNVNHIADKNNPSYKALDKNTRDKVDSWLQIVDEIHNSIDSLPMVRSVTVNVQKE